MVVLENVGTIDINTEITTSYITNNNDDSRNDENKSNSSMKKNDISKKNIIYVIGKNARVEIEYHLYTLFSH